MASICVINMIDRLHKEKRKRKVSEYKVHVYSFKGCIVINLANYRLFLEDHMNQR